MRCSSESGEYSANIAVMMVRRNKSRKRGTDRGLIRVRKRRALHEQTKRSGPPSLKLHKPAFTSSGEVSLKGLQAHGRNNLCGIRRIPVRVVRSRVFVASMKDSRLDRSWLYYELPSATLERYYSIAGKRAGSTLKPHQTQSTA